MSNSSLYNLCEGYLIATGWHRETFEDGSVGWWPQKPRTKAQRRVRYGWLAAVQTQVNLEYADTDLRARAALHPLPESVE